MKKSDATCHPPLLTRSLSFPTAADCEIYFGSTPHLSFLSMRRQISTRPRVIIAVFVWTQTVACKCSQLVYDHDLPPGIFVAGAWSAKLLVPAANNWQQHNEKNSAFVNFLHEKRLVRHLFVVIFIVCLWLEWRISWTKVKVIDTSLYSQQTM